MGKDVCTLYRITYLRFYAFYIGREVYTHNMFAKEGGPGIFKSIASIGTSGLWKLFMRLYEFVSMQYSSNYSYLCTSIYNV